MNATESRPPTLATRMGTRVGVDYWPAVTHAPGVGRYVRELVRALVRLDECPPLGLYELGPGRRALPKSSLGLEGARKGLSIKRRRARLPRRLVDGLSDHVGLTAERLLGGVGLFHRALPDRPHLGSVPEVLPVSEIPVQEDARTPWRRALHRAAAVITFSTDMGRRLVRDHGLDPERLNVLGVGCDHWARDLEGEEVEVDPTRLVVLGALDPARSPGALLRALALLARSGVDLHLDWIGRAKAGSEEFHRFAEEGPLAGRVRWIHAPVESELPRQVARASVLVHLPTEEGTPVTPLEACALGTAVLATRLPALEEALGDEARWVEPEELLEDPRGLAWKLGQALEHARDSAARSSRLRLAREFTWEAHARSTLDVWSKVLSR